MLRIVSQQYIFQMGIKFQNMLDFFEFVVVIAPAGKKKISKAGFDVF